MTEGVKLLLYFILSIAISAVFAPFVIKLMTRLKAKQTVLGYVTQHQFKTGTPTMGGFIFLLPAFIFALVEFNMLSIVALALSLGFCVLGFLDDFIKVKFSRNLGLKAYQKVIGQLGLAAVAGYFCYSSEFIGTSINLPFSDAVLNLSWGIIPLCIVVFVATTNSVNLTDGLDGLAGYSSAAYFLGFTILLFLTYLDEKSAGNLAYAEELFGLATLSTATLGGLFGYLLFNSYPSKIMMGDTGSLALGAMCAGIAIFSKNPLLILSSGIMFVWSSISVILQVLFFKLTKKRIFLMAPFHHHLEMKGLHESKIVTIYFVASLIGGAITLIGSRVV
ncbi:MAG: phospho-N-acetylmuramoyl-pentapeptide-transferase [Clostridia bacterium]